MHATLKPGARRSLTTRAGSMCRAKSISAVAALLLPLLGACSTTGSYADPAFRSPVGYGDLPSTDSTIPVALEVMFLRNGQPAPANNAMLQQAVTRVFSRSGVVQAVSGTQAQGVLQVRADNRFSVTNALGAGLVTGVTYGAQQTTVTDHYEFLLTYTSRAGGERLGRYRHAIQTIVARSPRQRGARLLSMEDAFADAVEDVLLAFLGDLLAVEESPTSIIFVPGSH
jgi:hypothetical protein